MKLLNVLRNLNPLAQLFYPVKEAKPNNNGRLDVKAYPYDLPSNTGLLFNDSLTLSKWVGEKTSPKYVISMLDKIILLIEGKAHPSWKELSLQLERGFLITIESSLRETKLFIVERPDGTSKITCNPSDFRDYEEFLALIVQIFGEQGKKAIVKSIDFALTFPIPYCDVLLGMSFGKLRSGQRFLDGGRVQSFYIGKDHKFYHSKVYDKSAEDGLGYPCTRVEVTRRGSDFGNPTLEELPKISKYEPFKSLALNVIQFLGPVGLKPKMLGRYIELISCAKELGFFTARRKFNDKGNFNRTFGGLVSVKRLSPNFNELFSEGIKSYFEGEVL